MGRLGDGGTRAYHAGEQGDEIVGVPAGKVKMLVWSKMRLDRWSRGRC